MNAEEELTERLFDCPYVVIDFLPRQVPADRWQRFGEIEGHYTDPARLKELYRRFAGILKKLACYYDFVFTSGNTEGEERAENPPPDRMEERIVSRASGGYVRLLFPSEEAMITLDGGDLNMTVYHPREPGIFLGTLCELARGEGVYVWRPPGEEETKAPPFQTKPFSFPSESAQRL